MKTVTIILTYGANRGPQFAIYTDSDGFTNPIGDCVDRTEFDPPTGYECQVPDDATSIMICDCPDMGLCECYTLSILDCNSTTTTTTLGIT